MPPKKEAKEKQVKGDEAEELVLQYLKSVNRPYASTDVSTNLKNKVPKAAAQKILTTLAEKGSLTCKTYGKQTIFVYNQSLLSTASADDLVGLDDALKAIKADLEEKRRTVKDISAELAAQVSMPKTRDLGTEISRVQAENDVTVKALLPFRREDDGQPKIAPMSDEDIKQVDSDFAKWRKFWVDRRKVYKELLGMLQDAGQVLDTPSFEEDQGIVVDEEEANDVESGEFCQVQITRRPVMTTNASSGIHGAKRVNNASGDAKKAKKVKA